MARFSYYFQSIQCWVFILVGRAGKSKQSLKREVSTCSVKANWGELVVKQDPHSGPPDLGKSHGISIRQGTIQGNPWGLRRESLNKAPFLCLEPIKSWEGRGGCATIQGLPRSPTLHLTHHTLVLVGDEYGSSKTWAWTPRSRTLKLKYRVIGEVSSDDMKKTEVEKMRREPTHIYVNQMLVLIVFFLWKDIYLDK